MITLIKTRYAGPTNTRGARVVVTVLDSAITRPIVRTIAYDDGLSARENHIEAAYAARNTLPFASGSFWLIADDGAQGFVFVPDRAENRVHFSFGE